MKLPKIRLTKRIIVLRIHGKEFGLYACINGEREAYTVVEK